MTDPIDTAKLRELLNQADVSRHRYFALSEWALKYGQAIIDCLDAQAEKIKRQNQWLDVIRVTSEALCVRFDAQAERIKELEGLLMTECAKLRAWARESREGGWSTHQVDPMLRRADEIAAVIAERPDSYAVADSEEGDA